LAAAWRPIRKDKAFFYANYEGLRQSLVTRSSTLCPTPRIGPVWQRAGTQGDNRCLSYRWDSVDSITDEVTKVANDTVRENAFMGRVDYLYSSNTTMYARYNVDHAYIDNPTDALGTHNVIPHVPTNVVLQLQHMFSARTINELKFGYNRANYHNYTYGSAPLDVSPGHSME
jgi:hypothetical protein